MDHEALLAKYMQLIVDCESIDYVDCIGYDSKVHFSSEEIAELRRISQQNRTAQATAQGCKRKLAAGQHWSYCGETDMGQTAPFLCEECGGVGKLAVPS